jgi:hypothetical protein
MNLDSSQTKEQVLSHAQFWSGVCSQCDKSIFNMETIRYWNTERQEVYCSAQCSLDRHEEVRNFETPQQQGLYVKLT